VFIVDLLLAAVIALVLSRLFWHVAHWGRPGRDFSWRTAIVFVVIVWLATWTLGVWLAPIGPTIAGTPIVMSLLVALAFSVLVGYTTPPERRFPPRAGTSAVPASGSRMIVSAFGAFFGILMVVCILALIARYTWR
jgi:hypothetical protein